MAFILKKGETIKETTMLPSAPSTQRMFIENGVENRHVSHKINKYKQNPLGVSERIGQPPADGSTPDSGLTENLRTLNITRSQKHDEVTLLIQTQTDSGSNTEN